MFEPMAIQLPRSKHLLRSLLMWRSLTITTRPFDGLDLFRRLRALSDMPMIFLSANAHMLEELDVGADEYIAKPYSQRFVVERVKAVLRRHQRS